jgi:hypothetical protein
MKMFYKIWWWLTWRCTKCGREKISWGIPYYWMVCPIHDLTPPFSEVDYPLKGK